MSASRKRSTANKASSFGCRQKAYRGGAKETLGGVSCQEVGAEAANVTCDESEARGKLGDSARCHSSLQSTGLALLPQAYVEACPIHPSYPAGHAVIAGACATILKAFFAEGALVSGAVAPSEDGLSLTSADGLGLTLGGELNKLAFNIPMGRDWAGIHYRSDASEGLKLGEAVAISILQDQATCVIEDFARFQFTKFDGIPVVIAPGVAGVL